MPLPVTLFKPGPVHCPGCHSVQAKPADACPHCSYSAHVCAKRFPFTAPLLEPVMDAGSHLSPAARTSVAGEIARLEKTFPQLHFHVCLTELPEGMDVREFGFWLFNASVPATQEAHEQRPWSVLLVIDQAGRAASLTIGYALDPLLDDTVLERILAAGEEALQNDLAAAGIITILSALRRELTLAQRNAAAAAARVVPAPDHSPAPPHAPQAPSQTTGY